MKNIAAAVAKPSATANTLKPNASESFAPIVTSLGKVGGGGYSSGTLDAQRENNRLTSARSGIALLIADRILLIREPGTSRLRLASVWITDEMRDVWLVGFLIINADRRPTFFGGGALHDSIHGERGNSAWRGFQFRRTA